MGEEKKRDKKEKDKKDKKEKKEKKEKDKREEKADGKIALAEADGNVAKAKIQRNKADNPPEKKLKAWQDDELEIESGEEGPESHRIAALEAMVGPGRGCSAPSKMPEQASKDAPQQAEAKPDTLDAYMNNIGDEIHKQLQETAKNRASDAECSPPGLVGGVGVMDASRVKSITRDEIEALLCGPSEQSENGQFTSVVSAQDDDDGFHVAFMAQMMKMRGEGQANTFEASTAFRGKRPGMYFKMGPQGLGYYRDLVQERLDAAKASKEANAALQSLKKKVVKDLQHSAGQHESKGSEGNDEATDGKVKRLKLPAGMPEEERMESDPDQSEASQEEVQEDYFDLVKRFTTKKTLPAVDHSKIQYAAFKKNFYIQVKEITNMKDHEVEDFRRMNGDIRVRGGRQCPRPIKSFLQCGLPEKILKIVQKREYDKPFPIQMQAIPALMCGRDVIGVAQTGSGKTLAYVLPLIRHALDQSQLKDGDGPIGFVVAPTRELALQIHRELAKFGGACGLRSVCAYGGGPLGEQIGQLRRGTEFLVGTPGRLIDVLTTSNGKVTNLRRVTFMVLDEADRCFDMGFEPQIGMFLQNTRQDKQVAMFSATLPTHVEALARTVLKKPIEISVGERNTAASSVTQFVEVLEESQKFYRLLQLLGEWHEHGHIIIFVHQQKDVDEMFTELLKYGYPSLSLHGGQDQHDRDFTLQDFKDGVANVLVATSVAARGIDVKNVILVVNFKCTDHLEDYIHRIGRTGRAGKRGFAYTFIQPDEADRAQDLIDALRQCGQEVPKKLRALAEEHQSQVNMGEATKRRRWGGFGGKGFKFSKSEMSQQQKDRQRAKVDASIGINVAEDVEEWNDPWEDDKPLQKKDDKRKKKEEQVNPMRDPSDTVAAAAEVAARMQAEREAEEAAKGPNIVVPSAANVIKAVAAAATAATTPVTKVVTPVLATSGAVSAVPVVQAKAVASAAPKASALIKRRSDEELDDMAQKMAEETLKNMPEEVRRKQLPVLKIKLKDKLRKAEADQQAELAKAANVPKPPKVTAEQLTKSVPGVLGTPVPVQTPSSGSMIDRALRQLGETVSKQDAVTMAESEESARLANLAAANLGNSIGQHIEELEIHDYPEIARKRISAREPLDAIHELTGARCWVKGQFFANKDKIPPGARKLYVEIVGPTTSAVHKAKTEVHRMMEALAIRTLNIPGATNAVLGAPGKYNPLTGK